MIEAGATPAGDQAQPAWGFRDATGHFSYELHRVYAAPARRDPRGAVCRLDQDQSYWDVTWSTFATGDERAASRSITYARARKLRGSRLTFARFTSLSYMRDALPELLGSAP